MTPPGSGNYVPMTSDMNMSDTRIQWQVILSAEHRVWPPMAARCCSSVIVSPARLGRTPAGDGRRANAATGGYYRWERVRWKAPLPGGFP